MKRIISLLFLSFFIATSVFSAGLDDDTKLLMHFDVEPFVDSSTNNNKGTATEDIDVDLDEVNFKWGTGSADFDGDSGKLQYGDDDDWDIFGNTSDTWIIDFWVKHTDHSGEEIYISQYESGADYWYFLHGDPTGLKVNYEKSGLMLSVTSTGGGISDSEWHHVLFCNIADEYGLFLDGTQVGYLQDSDTDTLTGDLHIGVGVWGGSTLFFDGNTDELRIQNSNDLNVVIDSDGTSGTYDVPTKAYGEIGGQVIVIR